MSTVKRKPKDITPYKDNLRHGEWITYYNNGHLRYRGNWFLGFARGVSEVYCVDGILLSRGNKKMDKNIGYWYYSYLPKKYYLCLI